VRRQLQPLRLATRQGRRGLAQSQVAESDLVQHAQLARDVGEVRVEVERLAYAHLQDLGDVAATVEDLQRLGSIARPAARLARHQHVGKEMHLHQDRSGAFARLAAAARNVEGKEPRPEAPGTSLGYRGQALADAVERLDVGDRVAARAAADRRLVHQFDAAQPFMARQAPVRTALDAGVAEHASQGAVQRVVDQARLARSRHAGHDGQGAARETHRQIAEIVDRGAGQFDPLRVRAGRAFTRRTDRSASGEIVSRGRALRGRDAPGRPLVQHGAARFAGAGTEIDQPVRVFHHAWVVLDDDDRVAHVAQAAHDADQSIDVQRVQTDGRLVEDIECIHQGRAERARKLDALSLAPGQGSRCALERQVAQPDVGQEFQPLGQLGKDRRGDLSLLRSELQPTSPGQHLRDRQSSQPGKVDVPHAYRQRLRPQLRSAASFAEVVGTVARKKDPHMDLVGTALQPVEESVDPVKAVVAIFAFFDQSQVLGRQLGVRNIPTKPVASSRFLQVFIASLVGWFVPGVDRTLGQRQATVGDNSLEVGLDAAAEALTVGTGAERGVRREQPWLGPPVFQVAVGTMQLARESAHAAVGETHGAAVVAEAVGRLDRFRDARTAGPLEDQPVDDDLDGATRVVRFFHTDRFSVVDDAQEAVAFEFLLEGLPALVAVGRVELEIDQAASAGIDQFGRDLSRRLLDHGLAAVRAVRATDAREEQS